jgi:hypothetical protein
MAVNRATWVYAVMLLVFIAGLWTILQLGSGLQAPTDLAGEWESDAGGKLTIEQSGRFVVITRENSTRLDLKVVEDKASGDKKSPVRTLRLADDGWTVFAQGSPRADEFMFEIKGPGVAESFVARRTRRAYLTVTHATPAVPATQPSAAPTAVTNARR